MFSILPSETAEVLYPSEANEDHAAMCDQVFGVQVDPKDWIVPDVEAITPDHYESDIPHLDYGKLVLCESTLEIADLANGGSLYELCRPSSEESWWLFEPPILNALDLERSEPTWGTSEEGNTNEILRVRRFAFQDWVVEGHQLFAQHGMHGVLFATEQARAHIANRNLSGIDFIKI